MRPRIHLQNSSPSCYIARPSYSYDRSVSSRGYRLFVDITISARQGSDLMTPAAPALNLKRLLNTIQPRLCATCFFIARYSSNKYYRPSANCPFAASRRITTLLTTITIPPPCPATKTNTTSHAPAPPPRSPQIPAVPTCPPSSPPST